MKKVDLKKVIRHENDFWSQVFDDELKKESKETKKDFSSYWWESYYQEMISYVNKRLSNYQNPRILEAGCGSGKASILLGRNYQRTLLDISQKALDFAAHLAARFNAQNVSLKKGDIFRMPFERKHFELVWNIGVVEHYDSESIVAIFSEMIRVTKSGGTIAVGVPNFNSLPIVKARLLKFAIFHFIPGYRIESECAYSVGELSRLLKKAAFQENRTMSEIEVTYFGNPLFMETPKIIIKTVGKLIEVLCPKSKFLIFVSARLD